MGARILIVDDDQDLLHLIGMRLAAAGYEIVSAESGEEALMRFREHRPQLVVTDLRMGEMDGLALFGHLQDEAPMVPVIILTAHGTIPEAVSATQRGVFSFLTKPFDSQELLRRVADALRLSPVLDPSHETASWRRGLLSNSLRMEDLLRLALRVAEEKRATLILGPQGCGKKTLAEAMHRAGPFADGPFIDIACTDLAVNVLETLFLTPGEDNLLEKARGGVLYIRDIGAMPQSVQSRLFTFLFSQMQMRDPLQRLQAKAFYAQLPDLQVIVSSPRPLDGAVAEGAFRSDLFYLLSGSTLQIPSLGERPEDIPLLARHFLKMIDAGCSLAPEALLALQEAHWPGNVRQLRHVLEQAVGQTHGATVSEAGIRRVIRESDESALVAFDDARREFERDYLMRLLQATAGNVSQAARVAQRNRTEFYKLLARHGLDPACFKEKGR